MRCNGPYLLENYVATVSCICIFTGLSDAGIRAPPRTTQASQGKGPLCTQLGPPPSSRTEGSHKNSHTRMALMREMRNLKEQPQTLGAQPHRTKHSSSEPKKALVRTLRKLTTTPSPSNTGISVPQNAQNSRSAPGRTHRGLVWFGVVWPGPKKPVPHTQPTQWISREDKLGWPLGLPLAKKG